MAVTAESQIQTYTVRKDFLFFIPEIRLHSSAYIACTLLRTLTGSYKRGLFKFLV